MDFAFHITRLHANRREGWFSVQPVSIIKDHLDFCDEKCLSKYLVEQFVVQKCKSPI